jgi:hypothetical protein
MRTQKMTTQSFRMFNWACLFLSLAGVSAWVPAQPLRKALAVRPASYFGDGATDLSRRSLFEKTAGSLASVAAASALVAAAPSVAVAGGPEPLGLERCVYLILRVQEATQQVPF